jgi:glycosyltransferase involved in cell wall biosynthesis
LAAAAHLSGRRIVEKMTSLGWDDPVSIRSRPLGRWLSAGIRGADRIVAVTPALRERCLQAGVPGEKIETIPNGVDTQRFAPVDVAGQRAARVKLGLPLGAQIVTFIGFWSAEKGPDVVFGAWRQARRATGLDTALVYVGSTDPQHAEVDRARVQSVRERIAADGLGDRVMFVEQTHDVAGYLQASDIFAVPSSREGLSNALLEAMSCGLPCVVAAIPGVTDSVIEHGVNGLIVPPRDEEALAGALKPLLNDDSLRRTIGERARATIVERYAIQAVAARYYAMYEELASR